MDSNTKKIRILYLQHTAIVGGATRSLYELLKPISHKIDGTIITPKGLASDMFESIGLKTIYTKGLTQFDNTRYSYYRSFRWLILIREFYFLFFTFRSILRSRKNEYDLIHCNEITLIIPALLAQFILKKPLVLHVRSLQREVGSSLRTRLLFKFISKYVDQIICIDQAVQRSLPSNLSSEIIHNCLEVSESPNKIESKSFRISMVGILNASKGIFELVRAVEKLKDKDLVVQIYGENPRKLNRFKAFVLKKLGLTQDIKTDLQQMIDQRQVSEKFKFMGFEKNISKIYNNTDVLCFPSFLDAPGRPVFEAALHGVPAIVVMKNPTTDVIINKITGTVISDPEPNLIADAIEEFIENKQKTLLMGQQARQHAIHLFDSKVSSEKLYQVYKKMILLKN